MKYALVHGERICQFANTENDCFPVSPELQWIGVADETTVQDTFVGGAVKKYVPPPASTVPQSISDRQFFQQLAVAGIISEADALASNAGVIPGPLLAIINGLPADQQFAAKMIVSGAVTYFRNDALTVAIGTAYGWNSDQIDAFFTAAARL
jgi:hypothetical protein